MVDGLLACSIRAGAMFGFSVMFTIFDSTVLDSPGNSKSCCKAVEASLCLLPDDQFCQKLSTL